MIPQESNVGKMLSDLTTRRVIILVLAMLISVPLFTDLTYQEENTSFETGINFLKRYKPHTPQFDFLFQSIVLSERQNPNPMIYISALDYVWEAYDIDMNDLRDTDQQVVSIGDSLDYFVIYDSRSSNLIQAALSIAQTIFVCIVLAGGTLLFSMQVTELVISPIEQMV